MGDFKAIIFDMDGVLVDSEPLFLKAINSLVIQENAAPISEDENREHLIGTTIDETWRRYIPLVSQAIIRMQSAPIQDPFT